MAHRSGATPLLLLVLVAATWSTGSAAAAPATACPEDSLQGENSDCKCVSFCPKHDCPAEQQLVMVQPAIPETPGRCCPVYECRNQATLSYIQEEPLTQCLDHSGVQREPGEQWLDESDPCMDCGCDAGGKVSCQTRMCRSCMRPLPRRPGECCPRCDEEQCLPLPGCELRDCEHGREVDRAGCELCRCRERPNEVEDACPRTDCELSCELGLLMDEDGCEVCQCRPHALCPAKLFCHRRCPQGYRSDPRNGCPVCRCLGTCVDELNVTHPEGTSWSNKACSSCVCEPSGQISCNETVCSVACSDPLPPPPGHCCPVCPTMPPNDLSPSLHGWGIVPIVLMTILAVICIVMMVHIVRSRFRARLAPSEADFTGFSSSQQYYKCVPVFETHVPVLKHAEKLAPI